MQLQGSCCPSWGEVVCLFVLVQLLWGHQAPVSNLSLCSGRTPNISIGSPGWTLVGISFGLWWVTYFGAGVYTCPSPNPQSSQFLSSAKTKLGSCLYLVSKLSASLLEVAKPLRTAQMYHRVPGSP